MDRRQLFASLEKRRRLSADELSAENASTLDDVASRQFPEVEDLAPKPPPQRVPFSPDLQPETSDAPKPTGAGMLARDEAPVQDFAAYTPPQPVAPTKQDWGNQAPPMLAKDTPQTNFIGDVSTYTPPASTDVSQTPGPREQLRQALQKRMGGGQTATTPRPSSAPLSDDDQLAAADDVDRRNALIRGLELAGKQAIAGFSRTPVAELTPQMPSSRAALMQALQMKRQAENDKVRAGIEGREMGLRQQEADLRAQALAQAGDKAKAELDAKAKADKLKAQELEETKRHNRAGEGADWTRAEAAKKAAENKNAPVEFDEEGNPIGGSIAAQKLERAKQIRAQAVAAPKLWTDEHPEDAGKTFATEKDSEDFKTALKTNKQVHDHIKTMVEEYATMRNSDAPLSERNAARGNFNVEMESLIPKIVGADGMTATVDSLRNIKASIEGEGWLDNVSKADASFVPRLLTTAGKQADINIGNHAKVMLEHRGGTAGTGPKAGMVRVKGPDGTVKMMSRESVPSTLPDGFSVLP